jgi:hypothetical protein
MAQARVSCRSSAVAPWPAAPSGPTSLRAGSSVSRRTFAAWRYVSARGQRERVFSAPIATLRRRGGAPWHAIALSAARAPGCCAMTSAASSLQMCAQGVMVTVHGMLKWHGGTACSTWDEEEACVWDSTCLLHNS